MVDSLFSISSSAGIGTSPDVLPDLLGQVNIRKEILRGVKLSTTLLNVGQLWRTSPVDLTEEKQSDLWQYSNECSELDYFISHTWWTAGHMKYIALLVRFGWKSGVVGSLAAALFMFLLVSIDVIPAIAFEQTHILDWKGEVPLGLWCTLLGPPVGLVFGMCPKLWCLDPHVFFDALCINQVDEKVKAEGVYSIAGFLKHSHNFLVLWSPPYFSRLWCVYEVAAFRFFNPNSRIIFSPICHEVAVLYSYLSLWMIANSMLCAKLLSLALDNVYLFATVMFFGTCLFGMVLSYTLRHLIVEKDVLKKQLQCFDIRHASCRSEADRKYIFASVVIWFGSADKFNDYVRTDLRNEIMQCEPFSLSYIYAVTCSFPFFCFFLDELSSFIQARVPLLGILSYALQGLAVVVFVLPISIYWCFRVAKHFSAERYSKAQNSAINIVIGGCFAILTMLNVTFGRIAYHTNFYGCLSYFLAAAMVTWVTFFFPSSATF